MLTASTVTYDPKLSTVPDAYEPGLIARLLYIGGGPRGRTRLPLRGVSKVIAYMKNRVRLISCCYLSIYQYTIATHWVPPGVVRTPGDRTDQDHGSCARSRALRDGARGLLVRCALWWAPTSIVRGKLQLAGAGLRWGFLYVDKRL